MIIVFDLDDTLYPEITYVKSGIRAVSVFLAENYQLSEKQLNLEMNAFLNENGRNLMFNNILSKYGLNKRYIVDKCLSVYRSHNPDISLYKEAKLCLEKLNHFSKYLVTDGNIKVQRKKILALELTHYFKKTIPTYQYGQKYSKPSTYCFDKIRNLEKIFNNSDLVYIGDNPYKDFINLKKSGYNTIRVLTGGYKDVRLSSEYEATININSLIDLTPELIKDIRK